jgi:hypothetical protein
VKEIFTLLMMFSCTSSEVVGKQMSEYPHCALDFDGTVFKPRGPEAIYKGSV